jgi:hypothetical protein
MAIATSECADAAKFENTPKYLILLVQLGGNQNYTHSALKRLTNLRSRQLLL